MKYNEGIKGKLIVKAFQGLKGYDFVFVRDEMGNDHTIAPDDCIYLGRTNVIVRESDIQRGLATARPDILWAIIQDVDVILYSAIETFEDMNPEE
jgi:hypothetical protein